MSNSDNHSNNLAVVPHTRHLFKRASEVSEERTDAPKKSSSGMKADATQPSASNEAIHSGPKKIGSIYHGYQPGGKYWNEKTKKTILEKTYYMSADLDAVKNNKGIVIKMSRGDVDSLKTTITDTKNTLDAVHEQCTKMKASFMDNGKTPANVSNKLDKQAASSSSSGRSTLETSIKTEKKQPKEVRLIECCSACGSDKHVLANCDKFDTVMSRIEQLTRLEVCLKCTNHFDTCDADFPDCDDCDKQHHEALCPAKHNLFFNEENKARIVSFVLRSRL